MPSIPGRLEPRTTVRPMIGRGARGRQRLWSAYSSTEPANALRIRFRRMRNTMTTGTVIRAAASAVPIAQAPGAL